MVNKMTKREYFALVADIVAESTVESKEELLTFIAHEVELLERKSSKATETKTQKENVAIMSKIETALINASKPVTISELQAGSVEMAEYSNQKLSALLKKLVDEGRVIKTTEKKKSYFSVPVVDDGDAVEADSE